MSTHFHISTESDYLRAHLTIIAREPRGQRGPLHALKRRATSLLKLFTNRVAKPEATRPSDSPCGHEVEVGSRGVAQHFAIVLL
jgi:hypothetical protein